MGHGHGLAAGRSRDIPGFHHPATSLLLLLLQLLLLLLLLGLDGFERLNDLLGAAERHHQALEDLLLGHGTAVRVTANLTLQAHVLTLEQLKRLEKLILLPG